jgi:tRNA dimethylallyltransferase
MNIVPAFDLLLITGPTASGKTSLAVAVAYKLNGEIISTDSRQVYRSMNLGTGKDYGDYILNGKNIPYYLIDIAEPGYKYNVFEYQRDFTLIYDDLKSRKVFPIVCGGSGMYVDCIIKGYNMYEVPPDCGLRVKLEKKSMKELTEILSTYKTLHNTTDIDSKKRVIRAIEIEHFNKTKSKKQTEAPVINSLVIGVSLEREKRRKRITERLHQRLAEGMVEEVRQLLGKGVSKETLVYYGLEYKFITLYLSGELKYDKMVAELEIAIHQFAKRQMTWFRGMERRGIKINWIDGELPMEEKVTMILELLSKKVENS